MAVNPNVAFEPTAIKIKAPSRFVPLLYPGDFAQRPNQNPAPPPGTTRAAEEALAHWNLEQNYPAGVDLFDYLLPRDAPVPGPDILPANFQRFTNETAPGRDDANRYYPIADLDVVTGMPTRKFYTRQQEIRNPQYFLENGIMVHQRAYAVTTGDRKVTARTLLGTISIALCIAVIIYEPVSKTAALMHVDKNQDASTIKDILLLPPFQNKDLEIHFYGGDRAMYQHSKGTSTRLLDAIFRFNNSDAGRGKITICAFDVMRQPHDKDIVFDAKNGKKYCVCPLIPANYSGTPLDTIFRLWPNGRYLPNQDSANMAQAALDLTANISNPPTADDQKLLALQRSLAKIRLQWDGTPTGWPGFYSNSNRLICGLVIQNAQSPSQLAGLTAGDMDRNEQITKYMMAKNQPMAFELSLKVSWLGKWATTLPVGSDATEADVDDPVKPEVAKKSIVGVIVQAFQSEKTGAELLAALQRAIDKWAKANRLSIEGRY